MTQESKDFNQMMLDGGQTYAMATDVASGTATYVGKAAKGSATSAAVWQVKKITTNGNVVTITWADGDDNFDNIWDNRTSLSYA